MSAQDTDVLKRRPSVRYQPPKPIAQPREDLEDLIDFEFGDYGRDPRFVPGWWILPGICLSAVLIVWAASVIL
jgi:hypothetical protein